MRIARLPDGSLMEFPPDFPDDEMDRAVRQKIGLPEPEDHQQTLTMLAQQLAEQNAMNAQMQQQVVALLQQVAQAQAEAVQAQAQAAAMLSDGFARLERAYLADTILVSDKNGKPTGTKKVKNGNRHD